MNADIEAAISNVSPHEGKQVGGYLKVLTERYAMIERRLPIFAKAKARSGRYYIRDNFLRSWLAALQRPVSAARVGRKSAAPCAACRRRPAHDRG